MSSYYKGTASFDAVSDMMCTLRPGCPLYRADAYSIQSTQGFADEGGNAATEENGRNLDMVVKY